MKEKEHVDLEEKFQISADVEFDFSEDHKFEGMEIFHAEIRKRKVEKTKIENVTLRKSTGGLF